MAQSPNGPTSFQAVMLFDGSCGICTRTAHWVRAHDSSRRIQVLPSQTPGLMERYGLTREQVDRSAWLMEVDGDRLDDAAALNQIFRIIGDRWAWLAVPYAVPPVRWAEEHVYRWIADHRTMLARWGTVPECERPGARCG